MKASRSRVAVFITALAATAVALVRPAGPGIASSTPTAMYPVLGTGISGTL
jgi:hypothetical protein